MVFETKAFDWFESYLAERQQLTLLNNIMSDLLHEDVYGVPQGSVLFWIRSSFFYILTT